MSEPQIEINGLKVNGLTTVIHRQIATRADLSLFVPYNGIMIELGVAAGDFAVELIRANPDANYVGVDRWSDHHDDQEMIYASQRINGASDYAEIIHSTFTDALHRVTDECADLIYIDGYAHTGQESGQTLDDWYPKLKSGGIFAGHDYCAQYQPTIDAVDSFVAKHGLTLNIINDGDHPSWWIVKP